MRKSFLYIFIIGIFAILSSCEKDETQAVLSSNPVSSKLKNPGNIVLLKTDSAKNVTFAWKAADFGFQAAVSYSVQIIPANKNFKDPLNLATTTDTSASLNIYALDNTLLSNNYDTIATAVKMRVRAILKGTNYADTIYSDTASFNITPFNIVVNYSKLYFAGDWNSWTFNNKEYIVSAKSDKRYEGYLYINSGYPKYKMSLDYIGWAQGTCVGDAQSSGTSGIAQLGDWGGNNIYLNGDVGYYKFNVNLNDLTYSYTKTVWALAGNFNSWADTPMTYNIATGTWTLTTDLTVGSIKFKLNGDTSWALNYGDNEGDGKLDSGGTNIAVAVAGNYTITLNLSKYPYKYTLVKN